MRGDLFALLPNSRMGLNQIAGLTANRWESPLGPDRLPWGLTKLCHPQATLPPPPHRPPYQWNSKPRHHPSGKAVPATGPPGVPCLSCRGPHSSLCLLLFPCAGVRDGGSWWYPGIFMERRHLSGMSVDTWRWVWALSTLRRGSPAPCSPPPLLPSFLGLLISQGVSVFWVVSIYLVL